MTAFLATITALSVERSMASAGATLSPRWRQNPLGKLRELETRLAKHRPDHPMRARIAGAIELSAYFRREIIVATMERYPWRIEDAAEVQLWARKMLEEQS
jgi:HAMP domain-containing protein